MGTRSLTIVIEKGVDEDDGQPYTNEYCCIYQQYDGYPEGVGRTLAEYLKNFVIVNGLDLKEERKVANGLGCLAAQMVRELKHGAGGTYLYPTGTRDAGSQYNYFISSNAKGEVTMDVWDVYDEKYVHQGTPDSFLEYLDTVLEKEEE